MFDKVLEALLIADTSNWKKERKYVVRRDVVFSIITIAILAVIWQVATNLWWVGDGYCWGDVIECNFGEGR